MPLADARGSVPPPNRDRKGADLTVTALDGNKALLTNGKQSVESPVRVETAGTKFSTTSVRYANGDGKYRIQQIRLGGTRIRLVFD